LNSVTSSQLNDSLRVAGVTTGEGGFIYEREQNGSKRLNDLYRLRFESGAFGLESIKELTSGDAEG
jgi:hypothetical protein